MRPGIVLIIVALLIPALALAAPCQRLNSAQKKIARKIFAATYPYDCCDETLDRCLKQKKVCKLARRLRDDICRRIARNQDPMKIKNALDRRARSMAPVGKKLMADLSGSPAAGAASAPVTVVVYACARCPFCAKVVPDLYRRVTGGGLKGKVKLHFRSFPIRSHAGSKEGGLAFVAAKRLGKGWPFILKLYAEFDKFSVDKLPAWAAAVGLDRAAFVKEMKAGVNIKALVASKKEGLRARVKATPTLFLNGRKYFGDLDPETLLDVLDEEADRVARKQYCSGKGGGDIFK